MNRLELTEVRRSIQQAPPLPLVVGTLSVIWLAGKMTLVLIWLATIRMAQWLVDTLDRTGTGGYSFSFTVPLLLAAGMIAGVVAAFRVGRWIFRFVDEPVD